MNFKNILFLDIETVPEQPSFDLLSTDFKELFATKTQYQRKEDISPEDFYERAGIWAEFGKIVCISVGYFSEFNNHKKTFRITSFYGKENELLVSFKSLINTHFNKNYHVLCAHNGKEFDFPFIARRMIINGIQLPDKLNLFGKKPWEIPHIDTMELWKFGDYKHFTSLKLLTHILGIPSPKDDISGSDVAKVYYEDNDLERIKTYCEKDTLAVAQVLLKFYHQPLIKKEEIIYVNQ